MPKITEWASKDGQFKRMASSFRNFIKKGTQFEAEKDRYHLYVSLACPWATRTLIVRKLKGLESLIPVSVVHYEMLDKGWRFAETETEYPGATVDHVYGSKYISELYFKADPEYSGRYTVPILWDKKLKTIVNNESSEIIRMLYNEFDHLLPKEKTLVDYYPETLRSKIDELNDWIYPQINNGVYKAGFATKQDAYEENVIALFQGLNRAEKVLADSNGPFLLGDHLTEADIRLFPTIIRFDCCYVQHFKCNLGTIRGNYPYLNQWMCNLYWNYPEFQSVTSFDHIKKHYTKSHKQINPFSITPLGPIPDIDPMPKSAPSHVGKVPC